MSVDAFLFGPGMSRAVGMDSIHFVWAKLLQVRHMYHVRHMLLLPFRGDAHTHAHIVDDLMTCACCDLCMHEMGASIKQFGFSFGFPWK